MAIRVTDVLRRAMYDANLTDLDVSAELAVDPKTVRPLDAGSDAASSYP